MLGLYNFLRGFEGAYNREVAKHYSVLTIHTKCVSVEDRFSLY